MNELSATGTLCIVQGGFGLIQYDLVVGINVIFFATVLSAMIFWYSKIYFHLKAVFSKAKNPKEDKGVNIERQILIQFLVITLFFLGCWACLALMWALATFGFKIYSDWYERKLIALSFCTSLSTNTARFALPVGTRPSLS